MDPVHWGQVLGLRENSGRTLAMSVTHSNQSERQRVLSLEVQCGCMVLRLPLIPKISPTLNLSNFQP